MKTNFAPAFQPVRTGYFVTSLAPRRYGISADENRDRPFNVLRREGNRYVLVARFENPEDAHASADRLAEIDTRNGG